jgi:undecaprenyl-diphosphatase
MLSRATTNARVRAYFIAVSVFLTVVVGWSRVYLGVHYATDVLAGWLVATAWAILCWTIALSLQKTGDVEPPGNSS